MNGRHSGNQVFRHIADCIQIGIARSSTGIEMSRLRNWSTSKYAYP
jgi:hypothetical protein